MLSVFFYKINFFKKILSGIPSECQTVWTQIRHNILLDLIWVTSQLIAKVISRRHRQKRIKAAFSEENYEGYSNMNASSSITFFTYMLRHNVIPSRKELFVAFKMAPNIKKNYLYFSSYRPLYKGHSCILKLLWSKFQCTFWYMSG